MNYDYINIIESNGNNIYITIDGIFEGDINDCIDFLKNIYIINRDFNLTFYHDTFYQNKEEKEIINLYYCSKNDDKNKFVTKYLKAVNSDIKYRYLKQEVGYEIINKLKELYGDDLYE